MIPILPAQLTLLKAKEPRLLYIGGRGSGKTRGGAIKSLDVCARFPGIEGFVTAPSHSTLDSATIPIYEEYFKAIQDGPINRTTKVMKLRGGGRIFFRTTQEPWLLEGANLGFLHMDEAAKSPKLAYQNLVGALRQVITMPDGTRVETPCQAWLTSTGMGFNWVYQEFVLRPKNDPQVREEDYKVMKVSTRDNFLARSGYLDGLIRDYGSDEQLALQQIEGEFVEIGGACPFDMTILNEMYRNSENKPLETQYGWIYVYHPRVIGKKYVIGADAASGDGEDDSAFVVAQVSPVSIDIVCCGRTKLPEAEFADILHNKSSEYDNAIIGIENAPIGKATIQKLEQLHAKMVKTKDKYGIPPTGTTKPLYVANLAEAIKNRTLSIPHIDIMEQLSSYMRDDKGKFHAVSGGQDDYVSALMMLVQTVQQMPVGDNKIEVFNTLRRT